MSHGKPITAAERARILRLFDPRRLPRTDHIPGIARTTGFAPKTVRRVLKDAGAIPASK